MKELPSIGEAEEFEGTVNQAIINFIQTTVTSGISELEDSIQGGVATGGEVTFNPIFQSSPIVTAVPEVL
jgi:hypothetical protein